MIYLIHFIAQVERLEHYMSRGTFPSHVTTSTSFTFFKKKCKFVHVDLQYVFNILIAETIFEGQFSWTSIFLTYVMHSFKAILLHLSPAAFFSSNSLG